MRSVSKALLFSLVLSICWFGTVTVPTSAYAGTELIGEMTATVGGENEANFGIDPSWGQLVSLTVDVINGTELPRDRGNPNFKEKHDAPPREVFLNSPKTTVSAATVIVNDKIVFKQSDFNAQERTLTNTYTDVDSNLELVIVSVDMDGDKDSSITVRITGDFQDVGGVIVTWYLDMDGDTFGGNLVRPREAPLDSPPTIYTSLGTWVTVGGDCNDRDDTVYPPPSCF